MSDVNPKENHMSRKQSSMQGSPAEAPPPGIAEREPKSEPREYDPERVLEYARQLAPTPKDVFDDALGPDNDCFSSWSLLYARDGGVFGQQLGHLLRCAVCLRNAGLLGSLRLSAAPDFVAEALEKIARAPAGASPGPGAVQPAPDVTAKESPPVAAGQPLLVLFGRESMVFFVPLGKNIVPPLTCVLIPTFSSPSLADLCEDSLQLDGALTAERGQVTGSPSAGNGCVWITFPDVTPVGYVRRHLADGQRVTDTVRLRGRLPGQGRDFEARARLVFEVPSGPDLVHVLREWQGEHPQQAPSYLARELTRDALDDDWRNALVASAEDCPFPEPERPKVGDRLLRLAAELREKTRAGEEEEKVVSSALRRGMSLLPLREADRLRPFLESGPKVDTRLVALQCLARRFEAAPPGEGDEGGESLRARVADCARQSLAPERFEGGETAAIGLNAVHALAALGDRRLGESLACATRLERPWLTEEIRERLQHLLESWQKHGADAKRAGAFRLVQSQIEALGGAGRTPPGRADRGG
jgi:hypothetical protein